MAAGLKVTQTQMAAAEANNQLLDFNAALQQFLPNANLPAPVMKYLHGSWRRRARMHGPQRQSVRIDIQRNGRTKQVSAMTRVQAQVWARPAYERAKRKYAEDIRGKLAELQLQAEAQMAPLRAQLAALNVAADDDSSSDED